MADASRRNRTGRQQVPGVLQGPAGEGEPRKHVLRRANSETQARKIFGQAEAALDTDKKAPAGDDVRAPRTIRMPGEEYLKDSIERGKQPRTLEVRVSRLNAQGSARSARCDADDPRHVFLSASEVMARYG